MEFRRCRLNSQNKSGRIVDRGNVGNFRRCGCGLAKVDEFQQFASRTPLFLRKWTVEKPKHEAAFVQLPFNGPHSRLADNITEARELLVDGRKHMSALSLKGWKVCLPFH